jgi:lipopolysaccharide export system protein LptC
MNTGRLYDQMAALISLVLLGVLAMMTYYLAEFAGRDDNTQRQRKLTHEQDYFVEHFALTRLNSLGQPAFTLTAERLKHFPDDDSTEYSLPKLVSLDPSKPKITLVADRGHSTSEGVETHLHDNVVMTRAGNESTEALRISTEYILLLSDDDIARTDRFVTILNGSSVLTGVGMEFNNASRQLEIRSQVRGTWVLPQKNAKITPQP